MERRLVGDRAVDDGGAVALVGEAQPVEPGGPSGIEVPLEADLVASGLVSIGVARSAHLLLSAGGAVRCAGVITKLGADVVSGHHHMW